MPSTFFGLNIAKSGLQTTQQAMSVIGHNIANASNPNYRRQTAQISAGPAFPYPGAAAGTGAGQLGSGVEITTITRLRDSFTEQQILSSTRSLGQWSASKQSLDQVIGVIGEPSDLGIGNQLDQFWNAWQEISLNPDNAAARSNVLEYGTTLASSMNEIYTQIDNVRTVQDQYLQQKVEDINGLAKQLAGINEEIQRSIGSDQTPNDLLDSRDQILSQLSRMAGVQIFGDGGFSDVITIGGHALVQGNQVSLLTTGSSAEGHTTILWASDSSQVNITGGELAGILDVRDNTIPKYLDSLDQIAETLITRINELHRSGYGLDDPADPAPQRDFFTGTDARSISVNSELINDPRKVAASAAANTPGDGSIALAIAKIKSEKLLGNATIGEAYRNFVSENASDSMAINNRLEAQQQLHTQLTLQQQSISGVSLDEEMTDMIRFQQSYNASARIMAVMDEMLDTLVNQLGR